MHPRIDGTKFGSIFIEGKKYTHDVVIGLDGTVKKRKKKLSKEVYGTSHIISLAEAKHVYEKGAKGIVIGSGQNGMVKLSEEARAYLQKKKCPVKILPTGEVGKTWNCLKGKAIGLFHVTC
ncbi:MAG: hypothetical protein AMS17_00575 [Spirochaetes bacterium DG_61]|nr:MAG: hypothetical protein AMS17_00575 [Spirochaetes bacterium DG_61]